MDVSIRRSCRILQMASGPVVEDGRAGNAGQVATAQYTAASGVMLKNSFDILPVNRPLVADDLAAIGRHKPKSLAYAPVKNLAHEAGFWWPLPGLCRRLDPR